MMLHEAARHYIGTPFRHRGDDPSRGIDCLHLVKLAARDIGWIVGDLPDYPRAPYDGLLEAHLKHYCGEPIKREPIQITDLQPSDIVSMHFDHTRVRGGLASQWPVCHIGIIGDHKLRSRSLIHTDGRIGRGGGKAGRVTECGIDADILATIAAVYRRAA